MLASLLPRGALGIQTYLRLLGRHKQVRISAISETRSRTDKSAALTDWLTDTHVHTQTSAQPSSDKRRRRFQGRAVRRQSPRKRERNAAFAGNAPSHPLRTRPGPACRVGAALGGLGKTSEARRKAASFTTKIPRTESCKRNEHISRQNESLLRIHLSRRPSNREL